MLRLLLDENFDNRIRQGLLKRIPDFEIERVQDVPELSEMDDPTILEWATAKGCIILTHDVQTMIGYAYARIQDGKEMSGLIVVKKSTPIGEAIDRIIELITTHASYEEWDYQVRYV